MRIVFLMVLMVSSSSGLSQSTRFELGDWVRIKNDPRQGLFGYVVDANPVYRFYNRETKQIETRPAGGIEVRYLNFADKKRFASFTEEQLEKLERPSDAPTIAELRADLADAQEYTAEWMEEMRIGYELYQYADVTCSAKCAYTDAQINNRETPPVSCTIENVDFDSYKSDAYLPTPTTLALKECIVKKCSEIMPGSAPLSFTRCSKKFESGTVAVGHYFSSDLFADEEKKVDQQWRNRIDQAADAEYRARMNAIESRVRAKYEQIESDERSKRIQKRINEYRENPNRSYFSGPQ